MTLQRFKTIANKSIPRPFVTHPNGDTEGTIEIWRNEGCKNPLITIVIPTIDKTRNGYLPDLLKQVEQQTARNWEIILIIKDTRQGRAINCGVALASGKYIVTFDDDTRLGTDDLLEKMVNHMETHPEFGMAGVANIPPENASGFVRKVMNQL